MADLIVFLPEIEKPNRDLAQVCDAVTSVAIEYTKNGSKMVVSANTPIKVDVTNGVALINGDHVEIDFHEYVEVYRPTFVISKAN